MKMDRKLVSKEKHEIAYCRKIAKGLIKMDVKIGGFYIMPTTAGQIKRICKSYLKISKK